jgi:hypothetical protein
MAIVVRQPGSTEKFTDPNTILRVLREILLDLEDQLNSRATIYSQTDNTVPAGLKPGDIIFNIYKGRVTVQARSSSGMVPFYGGMNFLSEVIVTGTTPSITFASIPQTYRHLKFYYRIMPVSGDQVTLAGVLNGDSNAANYDSVMINATSGAVISSSATANLFGYASNFGIGFAGGGEINIEYYSDSTWWKSWSGMGIYAKNIAGTYFNRSFTGVWHNILPITNITYTLSGGISFASGSKISMYGIQ